MSYNAPDPNIDVTLITGPLLLGYMFSTGLYGILCVQVFVYHSSFPHDPKWIKIYVALLFFLETTFSVFSTIEAWDTLGKGWGDPKRLSYLDWSAAPLPALSGIVTSMVHAFYCWRIFKLAKRFMMPLILIISLISATQLAMTIALSVHLGVSGLDVPSVRSAETIIAIWLSSAAVADIIIAVTLVYLLYRASRDTGYRPTISMLHRVIRVIVETGVVTSCAAIMDCTLFLTFPSNNLHFIMFYMLAKLYSNAIMTTLNSRVYGKTTPAGTQIPAISEMQWHAQDRSAFWRDLERSSKDCPPNTYNTPVTTVHILTERSTDASDKKDIELRRISNTPSSQLRLGTPEV